MARKDIDISFNPHPLTGDLATKTGPSAIKQSLTNIVLTTFYERGYNTELGTDINNSLFENNIDGVTSQGIKQNIIVAIENFEPQVELIDVQVRDADDNHTLLINIYYNILNNLEEQELQIRV